MRPAAALTPFTPRSDPPSGDSLPSEARAPGIDLLRALAIGAVMLYHASSHGIAMPAWVEHGWMGVDLFFVLSGYLIGWKLLRELAHGTMPRWGEFMSDRALRILPAYCALLALYTLLPYWREGGGLQPLWKFLTFTVNIASDWSRGAAYSHAWSLCVEEHFYLLLPLCVWLMAGRVRFRAVAAIAIGTVVAGMLMRAWLWHGHVAPPLAAGDMGAAVRGYVTAIYMPTPARLDGLLAGVLLAAVRAFRPVWWRRLLHHAWLLLASGIAILAACARIEPPGAVGATFLFPLIALGCACLLAGAASPRAPLGTVRLPGIKLLATLAFSLYLTHKQVYAWLDGLLPGLGARSPLGALLVYGAASLLVAAVLYLGVERPGLKLRDKLKRGSAAWPGSARKRA